VFGGLAALVNIGVGKTLYSVPSIMAVLPYWLAVALGAASGMLVNIILNFILIPYMEAFGSAISSLITQSLTALLQVVIVQYNFRFRVNFRFLLQLLLFGLGVIVINYLSQKIHYSQSSWMLNFLLMVLASGAWAFAIGLLSFRGMFRILKYG